MIMVAFDYSLLHICQISGTTVTMSSLMTRGIKVKRFTSTVQPLYARFVRSELGQMNNICVLLLFFFARSLFSHFLSLHFYLSFYFRLSMFLCALFCLHTCICLYVCMCVFRSKMLDNRLWPAYPKCSVDRLQSK